MKEFEKGEENEEKNCYLKGSEKEKKRDEEEEG